MTKTDLEEKEGIHEINSCCIIFATHSALVSGLLTLFSLFLLLHFGFLHVNVYRLGGWWEKDENAARFPCTHAQYYAHFDANAMQYTFLVAAKGGG
jgi:hypothetical protein